eukprot:gnl/TRDRNA2_/TRDRNA2_68850_c0_seq1.p1 gnl/TRDRNA2_/TRDRNA2_68850_c0~~gnl/TRDRNA2_/TRDRNA2_68850_c0_seq1.p1  ORF type:complete len:162 (+),score=23.21 gnl/TRDRNA2_/TRDRNA2_68850_c0_seq1:22-486(+)
MADLGGGNSLGEDSIVNEMVKTLEENILATLKAKGYTVVLLFLPLPPLQQGLPSNTVLSREKILVFRVKVFQRDSVNKDGWLYIPGFDCCQVTADCITPLSQDCRTLAKTVPPELMQRLRNQYSMTVRCEGTSSSEQARYLSQLGWPPEAWGGP